MKERTYGYTDTSLVAAPPKRRWYAVATAFFFAITLILAFWFALDAKLLFGEDWLSETYDNPNWRTNEGNLRTFGAWDLESHIWKTEYIMEWFPNYQWNPNWYLGMPLLKYYQSGFYIAHAAVILATGVSAARAALLLIIFAHLLATLLTFLLCYKTSGKIWISALLSTFVLSNTFISLRSYGWEPITVTFLFLFPLGLYVFLKEPLRPLRFWLIIILAASYLAHPLLWFSLCMTMGIYLFSIAVRRTDEPVAAYRHYIWHFVILVLCSILLGAVQFVPQISYHQVSSGAHMGVTYLPFYQVPPNIITLKDFFIDAGNLKGPGLVLLMAFFLLIFFFIADYLKKYREKNTRNSRATVRTAPRTAPKWVSTILGHELIAGLALVLFAMVLFYYLELYNIFPMNVLRSIQYHRIIPEFIIVAAVLVASLSNIARDGVRKAVYYAIVIAFTLASLIVIYNIQGYWETTETISQKPEFINEPFEGRFSMPYTDQSFAVRNSNVPQAYGYYEQGITNAYVDEIFSVSSGYHNLDLTVLYLSAANVARLYVNTEEGLRGEIVTSRLTGSLNFVHEEGARYGYFEIPFANPSFAQAVDGGAATIVERLEPGCRVLYQDTYCGSEREEFVSTDPKEVAYLTAYVNLLEQPYAANASVHMRDPNHYVITVHDATEATAIVVKMTHDTDFTAWVDGRRVPIEPFGPQFMLIRPSQAGEYKILLEYDPGLLLKIGAGISLLSLIVLIGIFVWRRMK